MNPTKTTDAKTYRSTRTDAFADLARAALEIALDTSIGNLSTWQAQDLHRALWAGALGQHPATGNALRNVLEDMASGIPTRRELLEAEPVLEQPAATSAPRCPDCGALLGHNGESMSSPHLVWLCPSVACDYQTGPGAEVLEQPAATSATRGDDEPPSFGLAVARYKQSLADADDAADFPPGRRVTGRRFYWNGADVLEKPTTYGTRGSVRGDCRHKHRTLGAALACKAKDDAACKRGNGSSSYSDRAVYRHDGRSLTERELEEVLGE